MRMDWRCLDCKREFSTSDMRTELPTEECQSERQQAYQTGSEYEVIINH